MRVFVIVAVGILALGVSAAAQAVDLDQDKKDGRGDVYDVSNASGQGAGAVNVDGHEDIDIVAAESRRSGERLFLGMTVQGRIRDDQPTGGAFDSWKQFEYQWALDVRDEEGMEYRVVYAAGEARLHNQSAENPFATVRLESTRAGANLTVVVVIEELGLMERFVLAAAAAETWCSKSGDNPCFTHIIDTVGSFPGYEWLPNQGDDKEEPSLGFAGTLAALAAAVVVSSMVSRNPRNKAR